MAKPVEIEILLKDRLSAGLDKAGRKVDELKAKTTGASAEMERAFSGQAISSGLEKDFKRLSRMSMDAFGSISDNARKIAKEMQEDILSLSNVDKMMRLLNRSYENGEVATQDYIDAQARLTVLREQITASILQEEQALKRDTAQMEVAGDSITSMQAKVSLLVGEYMKLSEAQRNSTQGEGLLKQMSELQGKLDAAQASMNKFGMAGRTQFNMLGMSMQQIVRELPSLAMGPQMFFLAISNNLPMFTDALAQARREYQLLTEAGKTAVPVWRQVMKSLLSWQTALSALPAVLIVLGPQIADFFNSFFTGKDKIDRAKEAVKQFNETMLKGEKDAQQEITNLRILYDATQNLAEPMNERKAAVDELQRLYPDYLGKFSDEEILAGKAADSYTRLAASIVAASKARAAQEKMVEQQSIVLDNEQKINEAYARLAPLQNKLDEAEKALNAAEFAASQRAASLSTSGTRTLAIGGDVSVQNARSIRDELKRQVGDMEEEIAGYRTAIYEANKLSHDLERSINIEDLLFNPHESEDEEKNRQALDKLKGYLSEYTQLQADNEDRQISLMKDGTDRQLAEINLRYDRELEAVKRLQKELEQAQGGKLTDGQTSTFNEAFAGIEAGRRRDTGNVLDEQNRKQKEAQNEKINNQEKSWNEYLRRYGTYRQKRQAIEEEYNKKIAGTETAGEAAMLQKEMEEALSSLDLDKLKESINWELVFSDLENVSKKSLEKVKKQLADFKNSEEYRDMPVDQKKVIDEALNNIQSAIIDKGGLLGDLPAQLEELRKAQDELTAAQDEYNRAMREGTDAEKEAAQKKLNKAEQNVANAKNNTDKATKKTTENFLLLVDAIGQLGSSSEMTLTGVGQLAGNITEAFTDAGSKIGGIIGSSLSLLDQVGTQGLTGFVGNVLGSVGGALNGVFDGLLGWTGIDFGGESDPHLDEDIDRLSDTNEALADAIHALTEELSDSSGVKAVELYGKQLADLAAAEANTAEMMRRSGKAYSNGFLGIGGTKSSNHKINKAMSGEEWERVSQAAGQAVGSASDFWTLTSEEMLAVAREAPDLYAKIKAYADDGYKNAGQYMDDYIAFAEQREELEQAYYESLTQVSFDSVYDSFMDMLMDMDASWEDMADDMSEYLMRALLKTKLDEQLKPELEEWYQAFGEAMTDGLLSEEERERLNSWWNDLVNKGLELRDSAAAATGYTGEDGGTTQSGKAGSFNAMSQDQGTKLEGMFTSGLMHWASMDEQMQDVSEQMGTAVDHLRRIEENTGNSAKHLGEIKEDIKKIIRDGLKMK